MRSLFKFNKYVAPPSPVTAPWDYDAKNISANLSSWPNTGTTPGYQLNLIRPHAYSVYEPEGGPKNTPCIVIGGVNDVLPGDGYESTEMFPILGNTERAVLVIYKNNLLTTAGGNSHIAEWGLAGPSNLCEVFTGPDNCFLHFWGGQFRTPSGFSGSKKEYKGILFNLTATANDVSHIAYTAGQTRTETYGPLNTLSSTFKVGWGVFSHSIVPQRRISRVMIWDRKLTDAEIVLLQSWAFNGYGVII